jgi:hypothetical protein
MVLQIRKNKVSHHIIKCQRIQSTSRFRKVRNGKTSFFDDDWEAISKEELAACQAQLLGFIEAVPDREKEFKEV